MTEIAEASPRQGGNVFTRLLWFGVLPLLILIALLLPPFSLYDRVVHPGFVALGPEGGKAVADDGAELIVPPGALAGKARIRLQALNTLPEAPMAALPQDVTLAGTVYAVQVRSAQPVAAQVRLPVPDDAEALDTLDVYAWDGTRWNWVPHQKEGDRVEVTFRTLPSHIALVRPRPATPAIGIAFSATTPIGTMEQPVNLISPGGLFVKSDGGVGGAPHLEGLSGLPGDVAIVPVISNGVDGVVRSDWVNNILIDEHLRYNHAAAVAAWTIEHGYPGIAVDYQGLDPALRALFTAFLQQLADRLHVEGKQLAVVVGTPQPTTDGWDTGAYDWQAIGRIADYVRIPMIDEPAVYGENGPAQNLLRFAVAQIDRRKLQPVLSAACRDVTGSTVRYLTFEDALALASRVEASKDGTVLIGETVLLDLPTLKESGGIQYDAQAQAYWFAYTDESGQRHKVWLEDGSTLARKLDLLGRFRVQGVVVRDLTPATGDPRMWQALADFQVKGVAQVQEPQFSIVWKVEGEDGTQEVVQPASAASLEWRAPTNPGRYTIRVAISPDGGQTAVEPREGGAVSLEVAAPTPTPTLTPTPLPTATPTPMPLADAIVNTRALNVRSGPGTVYPIIGRVKQGDELTVTGKNEDSSWLKIQTDEVEEGWVFAELTQVYIDLEGVQVAEAPPTPTPGPQQFLAVGPAPRAAGSFGYGVQAHMIGEDLNRIFNAINDLGFNWVKQQVEWFRIEPAKGQYNWGILDPIVDTANARGVNLLFSVVKAPRWARPPNTDFSVNGPPANPQDFADFMGAMAARYRGRVQAYEIWNEQNLWYEWGHEPLDPARYVQLLAAAYRAIKAADPNAVVVSGALTPTGVNDGVIAIDDAVYLERMYQAGLARYCDAIGAHPSGYNNPPDVSFTNWSDPTATFGAKGHRSWFFYDTMVTYRNIMVKYGDGRKRIWPTEFGWASTENLGAPPAKGYEYAADNTEAEQAQFLVKAFQLARSWGWVGPMFVWNLNFAPVAGPKDEKAAFSLVRADWSPRPAYIALKNMPK